MKRLILPLLLCTACAADARPSADAPAECTVEQPSRTLPGELVESSGLAPSRVRPGVFWTHNDSGSGATLYAVRATGELVERVQVPGAQSVDWEDVAVAPCPSGSCLYIADIGNNRRKRSDLVVYRVPEPGQGAAARPERFPLRFPKGAADDAEAIFVLPGGELFVVTKGRSRPPTLFRYPAPLRTAETVELQPVAGLAEARSKLPDQVTGASASPSGEWVAIRTYGAVAVYRAADLVAGRTTPVRTADLSSLDEAQGEAVALLDDGRLVLTSEGFENGPGSIAVLRCPLPGR